MSVGELGNFFSYGFAAASVVAPLGTVCSLTDSDDILVELMFT